MDDLHVSRGDHRFLRNNIIQYSLAYPSASCRDALADEFNAERGGEEGAPQTYIKYVEDAADAANKVMC